MVLMTTALAALMNGLSHFVSSSTLANNNITEGKPLRYQKPGKELPSFGSHDEQEIGSR